MYILHGSLRESEEKNVLSSCCTTSNYYPSKASVRVLSPWFTSQVFEIHLLILVAFCAYHLSNSISGFPGLQLHPANQGATAVCYT